MARMISRRPVLALIPTGMAAAASTRPAQAQGWPDRPVRLLVPVALGGPADQQARLVGQRLSERLRQPSSWKTGSVRTESSLHVLEFDDSHEGMLIHPSAPVLSAALARAEARGASGADLLAAFVLGVETACRVGMAVSPAHCDVGWHITGTAGTIGAGAAVSRLLSLDAERTV